MLLSVLLFCYMTEVIYSKRIRRFYKKQQKDYTAHNSCGYNCMVKAQEWRVVGQYCLMYI